ncbi:MAG: TusE/DsrC/DsvC family sulfur relay protein [Thermodesulfobacteriota bacterium]
MGSFSHKGKAYEVDSVNFLTNFNDWDENFAEGLAPQLGIPQGLTKEHWDVLNWIRQYFGGKGVCPNVYETCRGCGLRISEMRRLFPTGYWRGACKLAGLISGGAHLGPTFHPISLPETIPFMEAYNKTYEIDVRGFLVNPDDWDEYYAVYRAHEMKIHGGKLSDGHWKIIKFLREGYQKNKEIPTIYETCEANQIDIKELERLFPDGYHRSAVKLAGLRVGGPPSRMSKGT